jgi:hypothetical protein
MILKRNKNGNIIFHPKFFLHHNFQYRRLENSDHIHSGNIREVLLGTISVTDVILLFLLATILKIIYMFL